MSVSFHAAKGGRLRHWRALSALASGAMLVGAAVAVPRHTAVAAGSQPQDFAYVADGNSGEVTVLETAGRPSVADTIKVGGHPLGMAVTPDGSRAYVTDSTSHTVSIIDTGSREVTNLRVGDYPSAVAVSLDGSRAYVVNTGSDSVSVIDNDRHPSVIDMLHVGRKPEGVAFTDDGSRAYVTNTRSGTVSVIDNDRHPNVIHTIDVGSEPVGVAVAADGSRAYVTNSGSGTVSAIDTGTRKSDTIKVGSRPTGVALSTNGARAYVTNSGSDTVSVIDTHTRKSDTVKVGHEPTGVTISVDGSSVLVTNGGSDNVSVIRPFPLGVTSTVNGVGGHPVGVAAGGVPHSLVVSMGDSFISGVAGRWRGNAAYNDGGGDTWGTDRAAYACNDRTGRCRTDTGRVYGATAGGCLRADSAEVLNAGLDVQRRLNLACSGAETRNVVPGGEWWKGEAPQADQLRFAARHERIRMIVVNIGGNDLGFRGIITSCIKTFVRVRHVKHCHETESPALVDGLKKTEPKVSKSIEGIQRVMAESGYADGSYRLVLQSYPNPVAPGAENRYSESGYVRLYQGGCPIYNDDSNWVVGTVVPDISAMLGRVARARHIEFLDVRELFRYHEVCARKAELADSRLSGRSSGFDSVSEYARYLDLTSSQGGIRDETVHPNYFGQRLLGSCLREVYKYTGGAPEHVCTHLTYDPVSDVRLNHTDWH